MHLLQDLGVITHADSFQWWAIPDAALKKQPMIQSSQVLQNTFLWRGNGTRLGSENWMGYGLRLQLDMVWFTKFPNP